MAVNQNTLGSFLWGQGGVALTPEQLTVLRAIQAKKDAKGVDYSPVVSPWQGAARLGDAFVDVLQDRRLNQADASNKQADDSLMGGLSSLINGDASIPAPAAAGQIAASSPSPASVASSAPPDLTKNDIYNGFIGTVKEGGLTNPYGLAALAATGQHESAFSPSNANREWNDGANNAGGILSWNGPRLQALKAANGGTYGTPQQQAKFFLSEDPQLIADLNGAKSLEEAQARINKAWGFKDPGGRESAARLSAAAGFLPTFTNTQVASAQPQTATDAIQAQAPVTYQDPQVTTAYAQPASTNALQAPDVSSLVPPPPVTAPQNQGFQPPGAGVVPTQMVQSQRMAPQLPPPTNVANAPQVASVQPQQQAQAAQPQYNTAQQQAAPQQVAQAVPQRTQINPAIIKALTS